MRGNITRRGKNSWRLKFDLGTDLKTGKRLTRYHTVTGTKKEAQLELAKLINSVGDGEFVDPSRMTIAAFLDRWEEFSQSRVSPKTFERYSQLLNHVRKHLGTKPVQKLQAVDLIGLYASLQREGRGSNRGLANRTVKHVHKVFGRALRDAVTWNLIRQYPAALVTSPRVVAAEMKVLTPDQIKSVLGHMRGRSLYPIVALALATGMRRGEVLALRWQDIDLDAGRVRVERSIEQTRKGGLRVKEPKTPHSRRTISIPPTTVGELRTHWAQEQQRRLALGLGRASRDDLVFPTFDNRMRAPDCVGKQFVEAIAPLKLPGIGLHSLRHSHCSALIAGGMDVLTVSRRLGHASASITLGTYAHLFHTDDRAAEIMEATLRAAD